MTIFTAHEEYKIIETRKFWEIRLQKGRVINKKHDIKYSFFFFLAVNKNRFRSDIS